MHQDNTVIAVYKGYIPFYDVNGFCYAVSKVPGMPNLNWSELVYDTDMNQLWPIAKEVKGELEAYDEIGMTVAPALKTLQFANSQYDTALLHAAVVQAIKLLDRIKLQVVRAIPPKADCIATVEIIKQNK